MTLWALDRWGTRWLGGRELALARVAAIIPMNLLPAFAPLVLPLHAGTRLGEQLAYAFCEVPDRGTVLASVPVCGSLETSYADCRDGRVVEYDLRSKERVAEYRFFSPAFYGRLELIECFEDEVQVAVQGAMIRGESFLNTVFAFPIADPSVFNPSVAGKGVGITIAHDEKHDAIFYAGEFTHRLVRYDRATQRLEEVGDRELAREWFEPVTLSRRTGSSIVYTGSIHPGRDRIYVAEWMQGRFAYAIDLETRQVVRRYDVGGGGALGITVDAERDRLFVTTMWGFHVFDLATDRRIASRRMGTGNRPVIVDTARNRLYLSSTVEGKIRVLDRDSFDVIGQIPIGMGSRFPHLSRDGALFFASSATAHHWWSADTLVK
jgi:hypothetical protein